MEWPYVHDWLPVESKERVVLGAVARRDDWMDGAEFARARLGFAPDARQAEVLRSESKRGILNCSRQWGKSTVAAAMAVRRAATRARVVVLVASPSRRQSGELLLKARGMAERAGMPVRGGGAGAESIRFPNGSRIVALPGRAGTIRGYAASLLLLDEAAYMEDRMYEALRPMIAATQGDIWMMSTPNGKQGFFYRTWAFGGDRWQRVLGPATECAHLDRGFLEEERDVLGPIRFPQEYLCEFTEVEGAMFDRTMIQRSLDPGLKALRF
jgi:hypothetical protein